VGFGGPKTVVHPGCLEPPPEDELLTVGRPPMINPDFFSDGAGAGSTPGVIVATAEFWVMSFTPAA